MRTNAEGAAEVTTSVQRFERAVTDERTARSGVCFGDGSIGSSQSTGGRHVDLSRSGRPRVVVLLLRRGRGNGSATRMCDVFDFGLCTVLRANGRSSIRLRRRAVCRRRGRRRRGTTFRPQSESPRRLCDGAVFRRVIKWITTSSTSPIDGRSESRAKTRFEVVDTVGDESRVSRPFNWASRRSIFRATERFRGPHRKSAATSNVGRPRRRRSRARDRRGAFALYSRHTRRGEQSARSRSAERLQRNAPLGSALDAGVQPNATEHPSSSVRRPR